MRIGHIIRVFGISAALIAPAILVGCDDDDGENTPDGAALGGTTGTGTGTGGTVGTTGGTVGTGGTGGIGGDAGVKLDTGAGGTGGTKADAGGDATVG